MANAEKPSGGVATRVEALVRPAIEALGLRLWDVRFEKEGPMHYLRVFIDRDELLDTDTCELASRAIDPILDEADPISQSYCLEVGSPGLGRRLTRAQHFEAMAGREVRVKLYHPDEAGCKELTGVLRGLADGVILLDEDGGGPLRLPQKDAALVKLRDDEDLF